MEDEAPGKGLNKKKGNCSSLVSNRNWEFIEDCLLVTEKRDLGNMKRRKNLKLERRGHQLNEGVLEFKEEG